MKRAQEQRGVPFVFNLADGSHMRRMSVLSAVLGTACLVAVAVPCAVAQTAAHGGMIAAEDTGSAGSATGGSAPTGVAPPGSGANGGNSYGRPFSIPPTIRRFTASPRSVVFGGPPTRLGFRVDAVNRRRVRLRLVARHGRRTIQVSLGSRPTGRPASYRWSRRGVTPGTWSLSLVVVDARGRSLARAARTTITVQVRPRPKPTPVPVPGADGFFPVAGPHSYGDGFGVDRGDHRHNGVDLPAAAGTPLVSPRRGTVAATGYTSGAGEYVVIRDAAFDRSYVFYHLTRGSTAVREGQSVAAGQRIGAVGSTGNSTGPHLHFEIWVGTWFDGGYAIDPLPTLRRWDR
jgi:Peptidase family M23